MGAFLSRQRLSYAALPTEDPELGEQDCAAYSDVTDDFMPRSPTCAYRADEEEIMSTCTLRQICEPTQKELRESSATATEHFLKPTTQPVSVITTPVVNGANGTTQEYEMGAVVEKIEDQEHNSRALVVGGVPVGNLIDVDEVHMQNVPKICYNVDESPTVTGGLSGRVQWLSNSR